MRYRIWDPKHKNMSYGIYDEGYTVQDLMEACFSCAFMDEDSSIVRDDLVFMKRSSMRTVNTNDFIYEGDIVWDCSSTKYYCVKFGKHKFTGNALEGFYISNSFMNTLFGENELAVVGNIYENADIVLQGDGHGNPF